MIDELSSNSGWHPDLGVKSDFGRTISFGMNSLFLSTKCSLCLSFLVNSLDSCLSWASFGGVAGVKDRPFLHRLIVSLLKS